jgi:murein DD-endopeptidase MepM/ murein hydrolase activator NlpD
MRRLFARAMACALLVSLCLVPIASARPSGSVARKFRPPVKKLRLAWPAMGKITDGFGPRWGRRHKGIDIGILSSLRVAAASSGVVRRTGYLPGYEGYGQVVLVDAGRGYRMLYAHLSRIAVHRGQHVRAGQRLGMAGCTGSCTGTHLHFEVHKRGRAIDPMRFLPRYNHHPKGG